jgi:hypothetical protein
MRREQGDEKVILIRSNKHTQADAHNISTFGNNSNVTCL